MAAGVSPAVEPGVPPDGRSAPKSEAAPKAGSVAKSVSPSPGGGAPPSTAGGTPAATGLSTAERETLLDWWRRKDAGWRDRIARWNTEWHDTLAARAADPAYAGGLVEASILRKEGGLFVVVKDNGPGFDWRRFADSDPVRAAAACGRGLARAAALTFQQLRFNAAGNQVVGFVPATRRVQW